MVKNAIFTAFLRPDMILYNDELTWVLAEMCFNAISLFFDQFLTYRAVS